MLSNIVIAKMCLLFLLSDSYLLKIDDVYFYDKSDKYLQIILSSSESLTMKLEILIKEKKKWNRYFFKNILFV